jgi:hypothetical protein
MSKVPFESLLQSFILSLVASYILDDPEQDGLKLFQKLRVFPSVQPLIQLTHLLLAAINK